MAQLCDDRTTFVFWDAYHTSDATNQVIADRLYADMLQRFPVPPVPGMVPHPMYRPIPPPSPPQGNKLAALQLQLDAHPMDAKNKIH
ncbi:hypothetical protein OsI_01080 [Oryza sativa Indica Group]|uniref:GDSL esterase/lipase n=1 Tax=Oryza sativa subsp. indica TaxID=39946 RepID=B8ABD3_ORYSI|nr:hypothetical protein OsI_01080 [Oryza sativa Indica Group]